MTAHRLPGLSKVEREKNEPIRSGNIFKIVGDASVNV